MNRRILFVDDELKILEALERQLGEHFEMQTATGADEGLQALGRDGPFAVVVSDFRMPGMNGIQFLAKVKQSSADTTRVMLTGQADLNTAIAAVNEGSIFRFLTKPCPPETLTAALDSALEQYRLITSERELLERTLRGSVKALTEVLSLVNPGAFSHACLVSQYAAHMAAHLHLRDAWECELAAMLSHLGCITVPQEVLDKAAAQQKLTSDEEAVVSAHPLVAGRLLENIPRLEGVAQMIRNQSRPAADDELVDDGFEPGDGVAVGSAILRAALEFDRLAAARRTRRQALDEMAESRGFPHRLLDALETAEMHRVPLRVQMLRVGELHAGMVANQDIHTSKGMLLLPKGEELTAAMVERLRSFARTVGVPQPISVLAP